MAKSIRSKSLKRNKTIKATKYRPKQIAQLQKLAEIGKRLHDSGDTQDIVIHDAKVVRHGRQQSTTTEVVEDTAMDVAVPVTEEAPALSKKQVDKLIKAQKMRRVIKKKNKKRQTWW